MAIINIRGKTLGSCVINEFLILFTHESGIDRIYKVHQPASDTKISDTIMLFSGNLGFVDDENHLIQTLPFYENESIQKVYWIDGVNQPRVINIADVSYNNGSVTQFDFIQKLLLNETVSIEKQYGGGSFKPGVIQYAFTYFNKNSSESNIFQITPLNYISPIDRGGKPDEIINNTFKIELSNLESKFEYVRVYSIHRTSIDTTPEVKNLIDLKLDKSGSLSFIDNGLYGSIVSSDLLLYIGGEEVIPQCMSQKNNTLFLGNIQTVGNKVTPKSLDSLIQDSSNEFIWQLDDEILFENTGGGNGYSYPYRPKSLALNNKIKHFKFDETYRLGIQGQYPTGKWSSPIWLGVDKKVDKRYETRYVDNTEIRIRKVSGKYILSQDIYDKLSTDLELDFINIRPLIVPLQSYERTVVAQGLVNNTLGVMKNRHSDNINSSMFSYPDYLIRMNKKTTSNPTERYRSFDGSYAHFELLKLNNWINKIFVSENFYRPNPYIEVMGNYDSWDYYNLYHNGYFDGTKTQPKPFNDDYNRDFLFVDRNTVNFWSPEITHNYEAIKAGLKSSTKACLYGFAFPSGANYDFKLDASGFDDIRNDDGNISISTGNYFKPDYNIDYDWVRRSFTRLNKEDPVHAVCIPFWSPKNYLSEPDTLKNGFTNIEKSGSVYFGVTRTIKNSSSIQEYDYTYIINNPDIVYGDSSLFYKTNYVDNPGLNGLILYSKNVDKTYVGGEYKNPLWLSSVGLIYDTVSNAMSLKYNTAAHGIFSFGFDSPKYRCMPRINNVGEIDGVGLDNDYNDLPNPWYRTGDEFRVDIFDRDVYLNDSASIIDNESKNSLPIFDIYSDIINDPLNSGYTKYGGISDDALYNNNWIPCGLAKKFEPGAILEYTDGDTYIQRFDLLRVFTDDNTQINRHSEIISFICESFINLDGRSDVNRYNTDSSLMTPSNYGLLNSIYSQKNNYFNYNILDPLLFNTTNFTNTIIWSKTKIAGSINDAWTNLNMLSSIDLDGVYGEVSSINLFNSELYAFQPNAIARLLYNERIQQQASDGVSVELSNGYKIPEYRYITTQYGSSNKWSIVEGKGGIYFIDYKNKSFNSLSDGIKDLSLTLGFKSWFNNNIDNKNYILSYDKINNDIYIHDESNCLNYSELLNSFVSFFDYTDVLQMKNVWNDFISIKSTNRNNIWSTDVWINNKGDYNMFYGTQQPFSIEYLLNPEPLNDKVFNTFEYRLNDQFIDWNDLEVTNWYQYGAYNSSQYSNNLKRKFNVNRVQLPRQSKTLDNNSKLVDLDTRNSLNRIRSTWAKLKLSHKETTINNNRKFDMQDLNITYTI